MKSYFKVKKITSLSVQFGNFKTKLIKNQFKNIFRGRIKYNGQSFLYNLKGEDLKTFNIFTHASIINSENFIKIWVFKTERSATAFLYY
jgi:hypothetical protein